MRYPSAAFLLLCVLCSPASAQQLPPELETYIANALLDWVVPEYTAVDLRYGWSALRDLGFSLTLRNAFDAEHAEFGPATTRSEIARDLYAQIRWRF